MDFYALKKLTIVGFKKKKGVKLSSRADDPNVLYAPCTSQRIGM